MLEENHHILIFDSGIGGLSILNHLNQRIPNARVSYVADNAMFPYGLLDEDTLIERVASVVTEAAIKINPDMIIIACNSASTVCLPSLRERIHLPIIGVVPAIKPAAQLSQSKVIGLLGTEGTVNRHYTDQLIKDFAKDCTIVRMGSAQLVELAESHLNGEHIASKKIQRAVSPLIDEKLIETMDTVVLACTHFPLLLEQLKLSAPHITHWVDSGDAIARRAEELLLSSIKNHPNRAIEAMTLFTDMTLVGDKLSETLQRYKLKPPTLLAI